ncbi:MAG: hydrolase [Oscillospiraceae bacterium]|nr:hydrolase [Oscillospiraceae bacterium]
MIELRVNNGEISFEPIVCGEVVCESFSRGRCSSLSFSVVFGGGAVVREGDSVSLRVDGVGVFFGVVFGRRKDSERVVHFFAYDQLRYLKNKDTYVYSGKRASDVVCMIAADYKLRLGEVRQTGYVIPQRIEDNVALIDIVGNALDIELEQCGQRFVLFDDFGKLSLKRECEMYCSDENDFVRVNESSAEKFDFYSSVDKRSNRVKVSRLDRKSGRREVFVAKDEDSESRLGILQQYVKVTGRDENLGSKASAVLALRNHDERSLSVKNAVGDARVRGGCVIRIDMDDFCGLASVMKCVHKFSGGGHLMDLEVGLN